MYSPSKPSPKSVTPISRNAIANSVNNALLGRVCAVHDSAHDQPRWPNSTDKHRKRRIRMPKTTASAPSRSRSSGSKFSLIRLGTWSTFDFAGAPGLRGARRSRSDCWRRYRPAPARKVLFSEHWLIGIDDGARIAAENMQAMIGDAECAVVRSRILLMIARGPAAPGQRPAGWRRIVPDIVVPGIESSATTRDISSGGILQIGHSSVTRVSASRVRKAGEDRSVLAQRFGGRTGSTRVTSGRCSNCFAQERPRIGSRPAVVD